ncbi:MAG TPA: glycosyltransferase family 4 protein [Stellaceae bacterium]|nr:glycosyltransferase family 4 protein [Stellaceae bacterium]
MSGTASLDRVVVINDDAVERGGAASIALASARMVRQRGIPVTFLAGSGQIDRELEASGAAVELLGGHHLLEQGAAAAMIRGLFDPATKVALNRWIADHDTPGTVYHLHNWHKVLTPSVFLALKQVAPRLLMSAHDFFLACPNGGYFLYPQGRECGLTPNSIRCVATACDRRNYGHKLWRVARHALRHRLFDLTQSGATVVAVHEAMVPLLARGPISEANITALRNPVTPWRTTRVSAENNRDIFFIGRLDGDKGADRLARAARRVGAQLRLVGEGPLAPTVLRQCPDAELLCWRSRDEIATLVTSARAVVSPTLNREPFGLVALEALMSGIPVIVSENSPFAGEIVNRQFGLACDPCDEAALAGAVEALLRDDLRVRAMSHRAFAEARRLAPTPTQWCDSLLGLYRSRLGERAAAAIDPAPANMLAAAGGPG